MPHIAIYASAHGYGHCARCYEVARQVVRMDRNIRVHFASHVTESFFGTEKHPRLLRRRLKLDSGLRQVDSLTLDLSGTLVDLRQLQEDADTLVEDEADFLRRESVSLVLCDLPHLAFEAAAQTGIPAYGMANFSWDWIYQAYVREYPTFLTYIERIRDAYRKAAGLFRLPFGNPMRAFRQVEDVPLVARVSELGKDKARRKLGVGAGDALVLFSFGGFGLDVELKRQLSKEIMLISTDPSADPGAPFVHYSDEKLGEIGLRYPDLVAAADAVVSKPGYGIVSECIANRTPLLYTPRGDFREYPVLVKEMKRFLPSRLISLKTLASGNWISALNDVRSQTFPPPVDCSGAQVMAQKLLALIS